MRRRMSRGKVDPLNKLARDFIKKNKKNEASKKNEKDEASKKNEKDHPRKIQVNGANRSKSHRSAKSKKENELKRPAGSGAVYIANLPHGFYEKELYSYFKQFGWIYRLSVARSRKNAKPMGFAHIVFYDHHVAKIVAKTMDSYFMFDKVLKCKYVSGDRIPKSVFQKNFSFKNCPVTLNRLKEQSKMRKDHPNFCKKMDDKLVKKFKALTSQIGMKLSENEIEVNNDFEKTKQFQKDISNPPDKENASRLKTLRSDKAKKLKELLEKKRMLVAALKQNDPKKKRDKRTKTASNSVHKVKKRPKSDRRLNARKI